MSVSVLWYFVIKLLHFIKTFVILCNKKTVAFCERVSVGLTISHKTVIKFKR